MGDGAVVGNRVGNSRVGPMSVTAVSAASHPHSACTANVRDPSASAEEIDAVSALLNALAVAKPSAPREACTSNETVAVPRSRRRTAARRAPPSANATVSLLMAPGCAGSTPASLPASAATTTAPVMSPAADADIVKLTSMLTASSDVGSAVGEGLGRTVGWAVGRGAGIAVGVAVGFKLGTTVGDCDGSSVGNGTGTMEGRPHHPHEMSQLPGKSHSEQKRVAQTSKLASMSSAQKGTVSAQKLGAGVLEGRLDGV